MSSYDGSQGDPEAQQSEALNKYLKEIAVLDKAIDKMTRLAAESHELIPSFSDGADPMEQAEDKVAQANKTSDAVRKRLKRIAQDNREFKPKSEEERGELQLRISEHKAVVNRFMEACDKVQEIKDALQDEKRTQIIKRVREAAPGATEEEIEAAIEADTLEDFVSAEMAQDQRFNEAEAATLMSEIKMRNTELRDLQASVLELKDMFTDLDLLVNQQGELIDQIETNVDETKEDVEEAYDLVVSARNTQKSIRQKQMCLVICILVIAGVIVAVVFLTK